ncbi:hypothetical protein [Shewanella xiamenensis]|uniref:hypothetical protein n=1 Tax=Shewanella xiamenensis TaxID=332186 RepID=UPI00313C6B02
MPSLSELLSSNGIEFDEIIIFENNTDSGRDMTSTTSGATTTFYLHDSKPSAAIFISNVIDTEDEEFNYAHKYLFLIHELSHVNDFRQRKNIDWKTGKTDLIKAEIFAELSTLKYLCQRDGDLYKIARMLYASRLVDLYVSDCIYHKQIIRGVLKKYTLKKLKQWASA